MLSITFNSSSKFIRIIKESIITYCKEEARDEKEGGIFY